MISTTGRSPATAKRPLRRHSSRWCTQRNLGQVAQSTVDNILGHIVDISLAGFQIRMSQPLSALEETTLLLILDQSPNPPQTTEVKATKIWIAGGKTADRWLAGFRIDELKPTTAACILRHLEIHKNNYALALEDTQRSARPNEVVAVAKEWAAKPPLALNSRSPVSIAVFGFNERERRLLNNIVALSGLRSSQPGDYAPTYRLHSVDADTAADLVLVDADDANALDSCTAYLMDKSRIPTIKMSTKRHTDIRHHHIERQFVPQQVLKAFDTVCRELAV